MLIYTSNWQEKLWMSIPDHSSTKEWRASNLSVQGIAVNEDGYREALGAAEGMKEDKASWMNFFQ